MKRHYSKVVSISLLFLESCSFDSKDPKISIIAGNYYVSESSENNNDGACIMYSTDKIYFQQIASNCNQIYFNDSSILFSKIAFVGATNTKYFIVNNIHENYKKSIDSSVFVYMKGGYKKYHK